MKVRIQVFARPADEDEGLAAPIDTFETDSHHDQPWLAASQALIGAFALFEQIRNNDPRNYVWMLVIADAVN